MYAEDYYPEGFQWINCTYHEQSMVMFLRQTKKPEETLLFVCNFDNVEHESFRVGVPFYGKYKEILSSQDVRFGGDGAANPRAKTAKAIEWDGRDYSIDIHIPAMSVSVFSCTPMKEEKPKKAAAKATAKTAADKAAAKTASKTATEKASAKASTEKASAKAATEKAAAKMTAEKAPAKAGAEKAAAKATAEKAAAEKETAKTVAERAAAKVAEKAAKAATEKKAAEKKAPKTAKEEKKKETKAEAAKRGTKKNGKK